MAQEIVYKLVVDTSGSKPQFDEIKRDVESIGGVKPKIEFDNLSSLNAELQKLKTVRDQAFDFATAKVAQQEISRVEAEIKQLNKDLNKNPDAGFFEKIGGSINELQEKIEGFGPVAAGAFEFAAGGLLSGGISGAFDTLKEGFSKVIEEGSKFETATHDLQAITGVGGSALDTLADKARSLGREFGTSGTEQIEAYKGILSRLGPDIASVPSALEEITRDVNILSKATGDTAAASMDALTTAALQFGTDLSDPAAAAEDITKKMNTMAAGAKVGAAEVPQVADALKQAGVAAKSANVSFEETNAALQVLAAGGKFGSEGGVALRNMLNLLQKQSGEGEKALEKLGIKSGEIGEILTKQGLGPALSKLQEGLNKTGSDAERNSTLITLFGAETSGAAGILLRNTEQLASFTEGVTDTNTAFEQAAIRQDTFSEKMARIGAFFTDVAVGAFGVFNGLLNGIADHMDVIGIAAATFAAALIVLNASAIAATAQMVALQAAQIAQAAGSAIATAATWLWNAALAANPLGLIIIGIGLAIAAFVAFGGKISAITDAIGSAFTAIGNFLGLVSDVDAANANAGRTVNAAARSYEEYSEKIGKVNDDLAQATGIEKQVSRLDELQAKTNKTAEEQKELAKITQTLGDAYPEATAGVDDLTGAYTVNSAKLKELAAQQKDLASADQRALLEENIIGPTKDLIPALDAQKAKLGELREALDKAIKGGDKDEILKARDAYNEQKEAIGKTKEQLDKNIEALLKNKVIHIETADEIAKSRNISKEQAEQLIKTGQAGKVSAEQVAKGLGITREEAEKIVPKVQSINTEMVALDANAKKVAESAAGMAAAFDAAQKAAKQQFNENLGALNELDTEIQKKRRDVRNARTAEERAAAQKELADLIARRKQQLQATKEADQLQDSYNQTAKNNAALFDQKAGKSAFEQRMSELKTYGEQQANTARDLATNLQTTATQEFINGQRKSAELTKAEQRKAVQAQIDSFELQKKKFIESIGSLDEAGRSVLQIKPGIGKLSKEQALSDANKVITEINSSISKAQLELNTKLKVPTADDIAKLEAAINAAEDQIVLKEIEVGIRPKSDIIPLLKEQIVQAKRDLESQQIKLDLLRANPDAAIDDILKLEEQVKKTQATIVGLNNDLHSKQTEQSNQLRDLRIAAIDDDTDRERASIQAKIADNKAYYDRLRQLRGGALTDDEAQAELLQYNLHLKDLKKLDEKFIDDKIAGARRYTDAVVNELTKVFETSKKLSQAEYDEKVLGYDNEEDALRAKYAHGEIDSREFNVKLATLNEERAKTEEEQNGGLFSKLKEGFKNLGELAIQEGEKWLVEFLSQKAAEIVVSQTTEAAKTEAIAAGVAAQTAAVAAAIPGYAALAAAQLTAADAAIMLGNVIADPLFGVATGAANIAAMQAIIASAALANLGALTGFEVGGIITGEKGPELIIPGKDWSQFVSQMIMQIVQTTEKTLTTGGQSTGQQPSAVAKQKVDVGGEFKLTGRNLTASIDKESVARRSEIVVPS